LEMLLSSLYLGLLLQFSYLQFLIFLFFFFQKTNSKVKIKKPANKPEDP
jgi:hypothetical protein